MADDLCRPETQTAQIIQTDATALCSNSAAAFINSVIEKEHAACNKATHEDSTQDRITEQDAKTAKGNTCALTNTKRTEMEKCRQMGGKWDKKQGKKQQQEPNTPEDVQQKCIRNAVHNGTG
ncbi:hypothetical protein TRVL_03924 [Trypanosoma vivax]|nr:hypothetical protein TRVL_03924 [Trypanosoma vivax]